MKNVDSLVAKLSADLRPQAPLWSPAKRSLVWLFLSAFPLVLLIFLVEHQNAASQAEASHRIWVGFIGLLPTLFAGWAALRASVPAKNWKPLAYLSLASLALWVLVSFLILPEAHGAHNPQGHSWECSITIFAHALFPLLILGLLMRKAYVLDPAKAVGVGVFSSVLLASALHPVLCPNESTLHFVVWHLLAPLGALCLTGLPFLVWKLRTKIKNT